jgi:hypothetical protein
MSVHIIALQSNSNFSSSHESSHVVDRKKLGVSKGQLKLGMVFSYCQLDHLPVDGTEACQPGVIVDGTEDCQTGVIVDEQDG